MGDTTDMDTLTMDMDTDTDITVTTDMPTMDTTDITVTMDITVMDMVTPLSDSMLRGQHINSKIIPYQQSVTNTMLNTWNLNTHNYVLGQTDDNACVNSPEFINGVL